MIRVLIIDDHEIVISGLKRILEMDGRIRVVGAATRVSQGKDLARTLEPHVILLDMRLPDSRGVPEIPDFLEIVPGAKIIVLTGHGLSSKDAALNAGAVAFLTKELASEVIVEEICSLFPATIRQGPIANLSARERHVARLVASGMSNPEVAQSLNISTNTVKTHLAHVLEKLSLRDRVELALFWQQHEEKAE
jgi:DNA-binding NarL/FixJ family response regulator